MDNNQHFLPDYQSVIEHIIMPCCLISIPSMKLEYVNAKMLRYFDELTNPPYDEIRGSKQYRTTDLINEAISGNEQSSTFPQLLKNGTSIYFEHKIQPIKSGDGTVTSLLYFISEANPTIPFAQQIKTHEYSARVDDHNAHMAAGLLTNDTEGNEHHRINPETLEALYHEISETNTELKSANDKLSISNEELSQYAFIASHDLQEPLRKIVFYISMLSENASLTQEDQMILEKIRGSAKRMRTLLKDLLQFSKLQKEPLRFFRPIRISDSIGIVIENFEVQIKEKNAVIELGELPVINGIAMQIGQLFENLLSNALKFSKRTPLIKINSTLLSKSEVSAVFPQAQSHLAYYDISIEDNGVGFESNYAEQIFRIFERLHSQGEFPGSGIGLAHCRKIAANHGGYLYAESQPGIGSKFHFIIPQPQ